MIDITRDDIVQGRARIASDVRRTPLMRLSGKDLGIDCAELWLKHLQVGGSLKARGMLNRMRSNPVPEAGVVIASGGNAGIAVAVAAQALGVRCEVFVPHRPRSASCSRFQASALGGTCAGDGSRRTFTENGTMSMLDKT